MKTAVRFVIGIGFVRRMVTKSIPILVEWAGYKIVSGFVSVFGIKSTHDLDRWARAQF